jgi:hypothetical protein
VPGRAEESPIKRRIGQADNRIFSPHRKSPMDACAGPAWSPDPVHGARVGAESLRQVKLT